MTSDPRLENEASKRWTIHDGGTYIFDNEFHWDGMLKITGDFANMGDLMRYASAICDALNKAEIPHE